MAECDKSFTRSDALAKHMRLLHNISPPLPGRGSRKRKRAPEEAATPQPTPPPPGTGNSLSSFNTFKVEPRATSELLDDGEQYPVNGHHSTSRSPTPPMRPPLQEDDEGYTSSASDTLPQHLAAHLEPSTNLIYGRSKEMVMYLLMKAKHRYASEQHEYLLDELRVARAELQKEREGKEIAVDHLLRNIFGYVHQYRVCTGHGLTSCVADLKERHLLLLFLFLIA